MVIMSYVCLIALAFCPRYSGYCMLSFISHRKGLAASKAPRQERMTKNISIIKMRCQ